MTDLWKYLKAVGRHWIAGVTGGILAAALTVSATFHPLPKSMIASALLGYLLFAGFYAWREERQKIHFMNRREILKKIIDAPDETITYRSGMEMQRFGRTVKAIESLIEASDDFENERDAEWVCSELNNTALKSDPFELFELRYGQGSFKNKRLKFLRDARVSGYPIKSDSDAMNYIYSVWGDKNGLKEVGGESGALATARNALEKWSRGVS